jgi:hypothetical protein
MSHRNPCNPNWDWSLPNFYTEDNDDITAKDIIKDIETLARNAAWSDEDKILQLIGSLQGLAAT